MTLRRRADFLAVQKTGKKISPERWLTVNYLYNDVGQLRCGWTIPRQVGIAVVRNRLKRWCRVVVKKAASAKSFKGIDLNVFVRPIDENFFRKLQYQEFEAALSKALATIKPRT